MHETGVKNLALYAFQNQNLEGAKPNIMKTLVPQISIDRRRHSVEK
jgi:hypothetical protein